MPSHLLTLLLAAAPLALPSSPADPAEAFAPIAWKWAAEARPLTPVADPARVAVAGPAFTVPQQPFLSHATVSLLATTPSAGAIVGPP